MDGFDGNCYRQLRCDQCDGRVVATIGYNWRYEMTGIVESFSKDTAAEQVLNGALLFGSCVVAVVVLMYVGYLCFW